MNLIKNSLDNLKGHKLRVFSVVLWIVIGITSVILVTSIGKGLEAEVLETTDKVNDKKVTINFESTNYNMVGEPIFVEAFNKSDIDYISLMEGVKIVRPTNDEYYDYNFYGNEAFVNDKSTFLEIEAYDSKENYKMNYGRELGYDDENRKVILITQQKAMELFKNIEDAIGSSITIDNNIYEIVGILSEDISEEDYQPCIIPKNAYDNMFNKYSYENNEIYSIDIIASEGYNPYEIADKVIMKLKDLHSELDGQYVYQEPDDIAKEIENMTSSINKFIAVITIIAMFVGGIGVMNIMYMSVIERQKEIGIRRAIGATPLNIIIQFLIESTFITIVGGSIGIIVGIIACNYLSGKLPFKIILSIDGIIYATLTSVLTGLIFGIIPALKASKLDPIKAIQK
ncbi:MAG: ABC transporter permease [Peptostreptococcaceae bacterium]|nr:ABC transporter permease [Peptostreptococcaceae bacterium]